MHAPQVNRRRPAIQPRRGTFAAALLAAALTGSCVRAQVLETHVFTEFSGQPSLAIPDGVASGAADSRNIISVITDILSVTVHLDIAGDFNGDLYAYLVHDNTLSVLLNRPGRTAGNSAGYADSGFNISLKDGAANGDVHSYQMTLTPAAGTPLTGLWEPDGRNVDPATVLDSSPRTAPLSVFNNLSAGGTWHLFLADLQSGGSSTLNSWTLEVSGVPEPAHYTLAIALALAVFGIARKRKQPSLG